MGKFYKNKKTNYHPSYQINENTANKTWTNLELTSSPTETGKYIELKKNPNPNSNKKAYVRKYIRTDSIYTRAGELKKYKLSPEDEKVINEYINNNSKNSKENKKKKCKAK